MGMGKQSADVASASAALKAAAPAAPVATPSNNSNALSGAASGVGDAFRAGFGNQDAFKRVQDDLNRPNYSQLNNTANAFGSIDYGGIGRQMQGAYGLAKGVAKGVSVPSVPLSTVIKDPLGWGRAYQTADWAKRLGSGLPDSYNTAKAQAANSEGRRMTAGATMPVLNFMQNNPWAKYLIGAAGAGAVGYGLNRMFGGGGQQQSQQPQAGSIFQQSYNQGLKGV
jgi:hypothetical protein